MYSHMVKSEERPFGMSQLDWLWLNYNHYNVQNHPSLIPSDRIILTEQAIGSMIQRASRGGITQLKLEDSPDEPNSYRLVGKAIDNSELTFITLPKGEQITSFVSRTVTQEDNDNGCLLPIGTGALVITTNLGNTHIVSLQSLDIPLSGGETCSAITDVKKGVVTASVKVDQQNNAKSAIEVRKTSRGIYSTLKIDNKNSGSRLEVTDEGLRSYIPLEGTELNLYFKQLSYNEYKNSPKHPSTLYFITDRPYIYLGFQRFGVDIKPGESPIVSLTYDSKSAELRYKSISSDTESIIPLGIASKTTNGLMSHEHVSELKRLAKALENVQVPNASIGYTLTKEEGTNGKFFLKLKTNTGSEVSSIELEKEDYLSFAEQRIATDDDVAKAREKGVTISTGEMILILTLTSGERVYVKLSGLVDAYVGGSTNTIRVSVDDYEVKADLRIDSKDKILFDSVRGLSGRFSVKQEGNKVSFFGKTETDADKLGEITISDQLLSYKVVKSIDRATILAYPPKMVDGEPHDSVNNPITEGYSYIILTLGLETNNPTRDYKYNLYINVTSLLGDTVVSTDAGNILRKGSDGFVYGAIDWIEID